MKSNCAMVISFVDFIFQWGASRRQLMMSLDLELYRRPNTLPAPLRLHSKAVLPHDLSKPIDSCHPVNPILTSEIVSKDDDPSRASHQWASALISCYFVVNRIKAERKGAKEDSDDSGVESSTSSSSLPDDNTRVNHLAAHARQTTVPKVFKGA